MFLVNVIIKKPNKITDELVDAHVNYVKTCYASTKEFIHIGTLLDKNNGIYIYDFESEDEVLALIEQDPFYKEDIAEYKLTPYIVRHNSIGDIGN
ncbi:YciI family protein [Gammaproteobacteria bacterium]|nr:YciI family protein [Gammaproteobacteria bacterium]